MIKKFLFILFTIILGIQELAGAQATSITVGGTTSSLSATYNTAIVVDPNLTITANGDITGFRVQISQSYTSGDVLDYTGTLPTGITASFNTTTGILSFNGTTTVANWQTLLRTVRFKSTSTTCYANLRRVTFVAGTVYYNPLTEHYYEYVSGTITWTNSKTAADGRSYFGRAGYLATMASEAENNFIWKLMSSDAWFGASDDYNYVNAALGTTTYASQAAVEGKWHWISGPEKGTNFSNGNGTPVTVTGQYAKWAGGEPNNSGGEHYGQFYSSNNGQWNDLPNTNLGGYICEYGDMPGDLTSSVTIFTREISVSNGSSGTISGGDINVCSGSNSTTLTLNNMTGSVVRWESSYDNFFTAGTTITSTSSSISVTNITKTTYYRAIVNSSSPVSCSSLASSSVYLSVKPTKSGSVFAANNSICAGGVAELTLSGQQGNINKWQRSTDNVNWTNITNTTASLTETISSSGTYYYRVEVQTPNCGSAVYSTSKSITVTSGTPPTGGSVSSAVHATSTNSGTLTLSGYTGTVVKWQKSINSGVTWSDIVNTATTYAYTNQTDGTLFRAQLQSGSCGYAYSSSGMIIVGPFAYSGYVYNAENIGVSGIAVKLYSKDKTVTTYTLAGSYTTDLNGKYTITTSLSSSLNDFRIVIGDGITMLTPAISDAQFFNQKILTQSFNSKDYYRMDVNSNNLLTITDIYLIFYRKNSGATTWLNSTPEYRLFTSTQWSTINTSSSNLKSTYAGTQSITVDNLIYNGTTNFYIIKTGYKQ
jgi:hypothetical protein